LQDYGGYSKRSQHSEVNLAAAVLVAGC
jgi:hypothetical protein